MQTATIPAAQTATATASTSTGGAASAGGDTPDAAPESLFAEVLGAVIATEEQATTELLGQSTGEEGQDAEQPDAEQPAAPSQVSAADPQVSVPVSPEGEPQLVEPAADGQDRDADADEGRTGTGPPAHAQAWGFRARLAAGLQAGAGTAAPPDASAEADPAAPAADAATADAQPTDARTGMATPNPALPDGQPPRGPGADARPGDAGSSRPGATPAAAGQAAEVSARIAGAPAEVAGQAAAAESAGGAELTQAPAELTTTPDGAMVEPGTPETSTGVDAGSEVGAAGSARTTQATSAARVSSPTPAPQLGPEVRQPPSAQLATAVAALRRQGDGEYTATLDLHPAELGRVRVDLEVRHGVVHVAVTAEQAGTRSLLASQLEDLRAALDQGGLDAGSLDVADHGFGRESGDARDDRSDAGGPQVGLALTATTVPVDPLEDTSTQTLLVPTTGLDVRL